MRNQCSTRKKHRMKMFPSYYFKSNHSVSLEILKKLEKSAEITAQSNSCRWSPDGKRFAFGSDDSSVSVWEYGNFQIFEVVQLLSNFSWTYQLNGINHWRCSKCGKIQRMLCIKRTFDGSSNS